MYVLRFTLLRTAESNYESYGKSSCVEILTHALVRGKSENVIYSKYRATNN
jgi:hypothetical protein